MALLLGLIIARLINFRSNKIAFPVIIYLLFTFLITPVVAPLFGREPVKNTSQIKPTTFLTTLLNRNYVVPELNDVLSKTAHQLPKHIQLRYLDANFPFFNGFPLLPHMSHNDGKKIDISLMYELADGSPTNLKPSRSGYGVFVEPSPSEFNQTIWCKQQGYKQYDFPKYLMFGLNHSGLRFSSKNTSLLIHGLLDSKRLEKIFLEGHLKRRMRLQDPRIRFHGCKAVRHDDHIHLQIH